MEKTIPRMLNLGCGSRFHPDWINVNYTATGPGVIVADLGKGVPFPEQSFDVVYHSHLLEHFSKTGAPEFLKECFRVLRPGGVIRIAVPDLETIARNYLLALEKAKAGIEGWACNYDWMLLEMYDQVVRNQSGGEMARYLFGRTIHNEQFVVSRCGAEVRKIIAAGRKYTTNAKPASFTTLKAGNNFSVLCNPKTWRENLLRLFLGSDFEALQIGRFRLSGENHQWMYDAYSLGRLLQACGFKNVVLRSASESYIPEWTSYNLDTESDGAVCKPDSLFIEAIK